MSGPDQRAASAGGAGSSPAPDGLARLNALSAAEAEAELERCCGAPRWVSAMAARRPFADATSLHQAARAVWAGLGPADWLAAFLHHPRIGDLEGQRKKFASTAAWAGGEQAGAAAASEEALRALAEGNHAYEERFGFTFIVCATGKSAAELLALLQARLANDRDTELRLAAAEQEEITAIRLDKLLASAE